MNVDYYELQAGEFVKLAPDDYRDHGSGGCTGLDFLGVRWATPETFQAWGEVPVSELWHWCALVSFLDPSTIPLETALSRWVREMSAARLFQDRVVMLSKVIECSWGLDPVWQARDVKRSLVRLDDFRDWALRADLPLPADFPQPAGGIKPRARRTATADGAYIRQAEMIPGLLPFSPATLWRKVKSGDFPAGIKLSANVTAWRREDVAAWLTAQSQATGRRRRSRAG